MDRNISFKNDTTLNFNDLLNWLFSFSDISASMLNDIELFTGFIFLKMSMINKLKFKTFTQYKISV